MPLTNLLARDGFNRSDTADLNGSSLDGDGTPAAASGDWEQHPNLAGSSKQIGIASSHATGTDPAYTLYTAKDITSLDEAEHATEHVVRWPSADTGGATSAPCDPGSCAGVNPDQCAFGDQSYLIWFQRPTGAAHLSVEDTLASGTFIKVEIDFPGDGSAEWFLTITPPGAPPPGAKSGSRGVIDPSLLTDFCNYLGIGVNSDPRIFAFSNAGVFDEVGAPGDTTLNSPSHAETGSVTLNPNIDGAVDTPASESAYSEVAVRVNSTTGERYALGVNFSHAFTDPLGFLVLSYYDDTNTQWVMRFTDTIFVTHDVARALKLEVTAAHVLTASWLGSVVWTFDLLTDLADDTGELAPLYTTGRPGLSTVVSDPDWLAIEQFSVYGSGIPCEGGEGNPSGNYPREGPPPIVDGPSYLYTNRNVLWRSSIVPDVDNVGDIHARANTLDRLATGVAAMANTLWRFPATGMEQLPPPDLPNDAPPPFADRCEILNPENPGDLPPPLDVSPVPFAGNRFYTIAGLPVTLIGSIYNASKRPANNVAYFLNELAQAQARGGGLIGGLGGYAQFRSGGNYTRSLMYDFIHSFAPFATDLHTFYLAGVYLAQEIADDFRVPFLWPPYGLSDTELDWIASEWLTVLPWLPLMIRARPTTFPRPIAGVTLYGTQYDGPQQVGKKVGDTVTSTDFRNWRNREGSRIRGWGGGRKMIISPNYLHSGDGESGIQIFNGTLFSGRYQTSRRELEAMADGWFGDGGGGYADLMVGSAGYTYQPSLLASTGIPDGIVYFRNALMGLPSL